MPFNRHEDPFVIQEGRFSGLGRVFSSMTGRTIDDAFVDQDISAGGTGPGGYVGEAVSPAKRAAFFASLLVVLLANLGRAAQVQIAEAADYATQAEDNRTRIISVPAERGVIYDRSGAPLVRNMPLYAANIVPGDLPKDGTARAAVIARVAEIVQADPAAITDELAKYSRYPTANVAVAQGLTHEQAVLLRIAQAELPGVSLGMVSRREYLAADSVRALAHVLGYEARISEAELEDRAKLGYGPSDMIGKTGLERQYEDVLRGTYGRKRVEVDALGRPKSVLSEDQPEPGRNLVLAIDLDIQTAAEAALRDQLRLIGRRRGSVVVSDPRTGDILAMVSEPSYDGNLFARGISRDDYARLADDPDHPLFPRAIGASLASGSVFKPVVAAAAIDERIVSATTSFLSTGGLRIGQWFFPDWKAGGHGNTDLAKAIAESVNTWFYIVGGGLDDRAGLGVERIVEYARRFGLGSPTGIDLPGENAGFLPSKEWKERTKGERWYVGDTYHLAIGQGDLLVTPLQINMMTAVFANGGDLMKPRLVSAFTDVTGERQAVPPSVISHQVVSPDAITAVRRGMRQTVTAGSARSLGDLPVAAAAKTGTAQWHSSKATHAWFTSFAPYDRPEIVVTVSIEEGGEGSSNAAPVAKRILQAYFGRR